MYIHVIEKKGIRKISTDGGQLFSIDHTSTNLTTMAMNLKKQESVVYTVMDKNIGTLGKYDQRRL